jgi:adenylate kinase family enzyme
MALKISEKVSASIPVFGTRGNSVKTCRIHIMGASGAGVTSLGRALADALALSHHDADDYFWRPTTPPYREMREVADRLRLMREVFLDRADWVLSGSLDGWGDSLIPLFDLAVFLHTPTPIRLQRLRAREARRFGTDAIAPGGWRHQETEEFIDWASHYDDGSREGRNLERHQAWLAALPCRVLRFDGTRPLPDLVKEVCVAITG